MTSQETKEKEILERSKVIAVVGLSPDEDKPSNIVAQYLISHGYKVIPVNPGHGNILGQKSYKTLSDIPENVDIVDIFMRAELLLPVVEEAVRIRPKCIWLQLGIINEEAKRLAEDNGITFFMDRCIKIEHSKLIAHG
ncbi:MAG TPA: CoA-binding protein [Syntrophorhabdaceae bacterium]|nr:CoA-binding protein [Syntrophorhabdaceae bacterium]